MGTSQQGASNFYSRGWIKSLHQISRNSWRKEHQLSAGPSFYAPMKLSEEGHQNLQGPLHCVPLLYRYWIPHAKLGTIPRADKNNSQPTTPLNAQTKAVSVQPIKRYILIQPHPHGSNRNNDPWSMKIHTTESHGTHTDMKVGTLRHKLYTTIT